MFVATFNLSNNEQAAWDVIEQVANASSEKTVKKWMDFKFLGILHNLRHCLICDKYFLRRKKQFAASFTILLNKLDSSLLQRVSFFVH